MKKLRNSVFLLCKLYMLIICISLIKNSTKTVTTEKRRKLLSASTENLHDRSIQSASNTSLNRSFRPSNSTGSLRSGSSALNKTTTAVVRPTTKQSMKNVENYSRTNQIQQTLGVKFMSYYTVLKNKIINWRLKVSVRLQSETDCPGVR